MILRTLLGTSLLLGVAGFGFTAWVALQRQPALPQAQVVESAPPPPPALLLVAARALPAGTLVKDEDFISRPMPSEAVAEGALLHSDETRLDLRGGLLRRYLDAGATVARSDVLRPRDR